MQTQTPMPTLDAFLTSLTHLLHSRSAPELSSYLLIEPPYPPPYSTIVSELRAAFPKDPGPGDASATALDAKVSAALAGAIGGEGDGDGAVSWSAFGKFVGVYLAFLRDVDTGNLLETYGGLSEVVQKANSALSSPTHGALILPTVITYSRMLSRLAIGLDKQPHLIAHLIPTSTSAADDSGPRETLPERAANIIRQAFTTCLNDRTSTSFSGLDRAGAPEGRKRGIYTVANLCLRILFACKKTRGAAQIFENIYNQSPPLSAYPKGERVAYLYYLGRFLWGNGHAFRALKALEHAYDECHVGALAQRRKILIFLVATNLVCGRFPRAEVWQRPDAQGLRERFEPLCVYIRQGNLVAFRRHLDVGSEHYAWFSQWRLDLQLRSRCEVYVWRSLVRKTFILHGDAGNPEARKAPTVDLQDLLKLFVWQEKLYLTPPGARGPEIVVDPDFEDWDDMDDLTQEEMLCLPDMTSVFSKLAALVHQELLTGYLSHGRQKFAIQGARHKGALNAGFPVPWKKIEERSDDEVPGWKQDERKRPVFGGGQVVNLKGARPVGSVFG